MNPLYGKTRTAIAHHPRRTNTAMPPPPTFVDHAQRVLTGLADAITEIEGHQDELDKPALELVQLVGVEVQDITETITGPQPSNLADLVGELTEISTWLSDHATGRPRLVAELTHAIAAAINELIAS
ncbi:hypothetical protein HDA40_002134 [Hamadaea flava]|uniref:Uncharacterized protein n=1 Tax=Hamadaea flava TaxID=1742688 RepID=A0ABV8LJN6_9ACTN|nr:hypothetical protein [Hamadaea flava]MCP2323627.1 hypothetical protein [Hamadaea flava]